MSKKHQNISKPKGKKEIDEEALAFLNKQEPQQQQSTSRRRLKKLADVNHSQELVPDNDDHTEKLSEQQKEQYVQFHVQDDQDIRRQKQQEEAAKQAKKLKGNRKIDTFISNQANADEKHDKKASKNKPAKVQLTLHEISLLKKDKKKKRKSSDQFIVSDSAEISKDEQEAQKQRKQAQKKYKQFNGTNQNEQELVRKAMKLSLTASSERFTNDYPIGNDEINRKLELPKKSLKKQEVEEKVQKKPKKSSAVKKEEKVKKEAHEPKSGPFSDLVIAFTGAYDQYDKDELIEVCQQLGATCPKSVTKKCNLLFQGAFVLDSFGRRLKTPISQTSKSKEAAERGITIIPHDKIDQFFINKTGLSISQHLNKNKVVSNPLTNFMNKKVQSHNEFENVKIQDNNQNDILNAYAYKKEENIKQKMDIQKPIQNIPNNTYNDNRLWTEKYKPNRLDDIIGQQSQIKQLKQWLEAWHDIHIKGNKRQVKQTKGGWAGGGNINSKAALLSGDPGIGKTTTARLIAAQFNYLVSQFNASDVRNKSGVALLQSGSYNIDAAKNLQKSLIIMDEVDGMSSGDRGGVSSIIQMIKNSKIPIICVCNDRSSEKIRSLANHCLDVKFHKPPKNLVIKRLKQIISKEGGVGEDRALQQLTQSFQNDMRQILNYLEIIFRTVTKKITIDALSNRNKHAKDSSVMINHFDATRRLLVRPEFEGLKIQQRVECFFVQSDLVPLMVHQNILSSASKKTFDRQKIHRLVQGMSGFVIGDMLDRTIRKQQQWGLMPSYGFMSCVYTTQKISESIGFPSFPSWLGKNSSERKNKRLSREIKNDLFPITLCSSWRTVKQHYSPLLLQEIIELLKRQSVQEAVLLMEEYRITPATLNQHLISMQFILDKSNPLAVIPTATKSKLTRLFNKRHEDNKLKQTKVAKSKNQHIKFNPVLEMAQQQYQQAQEEAGEEKQPEIKVKPKALKKK